MVAFTYTVPTVLSSAATSITITVTAISSTLSYYFGIHDNGQFYTDSVLRTFSSIGPIILSPLSNFLSTTTGLPYIPGNVSPTSIDTVCYTFSVPDPSTSWNHPGSFDQPPDGTNVANFNVSNTNACFAKGTRILCEDGYKAIETLRKGTMVKTLHHGFKPITMIGTSTLNNPGHTERIRERLYIYPKHELIMTGGHAVLLDSINGEQIKRILTSLKKMYFTEGKIRLLAMDDDEAEPYRISGPIEIYNFVLESPVENSNYGIYANGVLVESSFRSWIERTMRLIE
jgi:hypothetical protein